MSKIKNQDYNISGIFKNFYVVPDYQREYVWEEKHVMQLLEDILDGFNNERNSEYFIGSIVVCENDGMFQVIDGQQRLTTLFLALASIKKHLNSFDENTSDIDNMLFSKTRNKNGKQVDAFRLELQYEHCHDILDKITRGNSADDYNFKSKSERNIVEAFNTVDDFLSNNFKELEETQDFLGYFLNNVKMIQIETPKISDALKIFETINERGVGLNPMDLLKNLIFRNVEPEQFTKLKEKWKNITDLIENNDEKTLRFLRYFIMANYDVKKPNGEEIIREDEIYDWITKNESQCSYESDPFGFVDFLHANANAYVNYVKGRDNSGEQNIYLGNIKKLGKSFRQHHMLLLAAKDLNTKHFNYLAKQIEILSFYYILTKQSTTIYEVKFSKWAKEIRQISTEFDLNRFIENSIMRDVSEKEVEFKNAFLNISLRTHQKYKIKYVLAKLTQYIDQQRLGDFEEQNLDTYITKGVEVEHILPLTPSDMLEQSFGVNYEEYKNKLGNLTLLEKPMNIVAGRNYFSEKKPIYNNSRFYLTKSIAHIDPVGNNSSINRTNQLLKSFEFWDEKTINERQGILFDIAQRVWRVESLKTT